VRRAIRLVSNPTTRKGEGYESSMDQFRPLRENWLMEARSMKTSPFSVYRIAVRAASHCVSGTKITDADMEAALILLRLSQSLPLFGAGQ
jgi:hypothetical protein